MDPERTVRVELDGSFNVYEDEANADAGETDVFRAVPWRNQSNEHVRPPQYQPKSTALEVVVPIDACPDFEGNGNQTLGSHCSRNIVVYYPANQRKIIQEYRHLEGP